MNEKTYCLGLYEKSMPGTLSLPEKLEAAREAGFDFVELSIDETDEKLARLDMAAGERLSLVERMLRLGIRFETICLSGHRKYPLGSSDPPTRERGLAIMEKAILLAKDIGVRLIQIAGYDVYYEPSTGQTRRLFADGLRRSVELAAKNGVTLAFETMETPFLNTVSKAMEWVEKVDSPYLMIYPDSGNITNAAAAERKSVLDDMEAGRGRIAAVHLKESLPGKFREVPYGTGHVDFRSLIGKAYSMGVRRYMAEFWYAGREDWKEDIRSARRFFAEKFEECGIR